ncbi:lipase 1-like [Condylostylus longicornis]|uniref:lipase 1-like n=1 Tax=Condylostylus longicornis TaxID=2530218 RepID=UPI00244E3F39|nr:lipase 1-like [Condylostylus longicornis]
MFVLRGSLRNFSFSFSYHMNFSPFGLKQLTQNDPPKPVDPSIHEDAQSSVPNLVKKYGYPAEIHNVVTEDGYILELHRIPRPNGQPVLLQHGILDTSAAWVLMGPTASLGYILYDLGYDVWMGNSRGNRYSKNHKHLNVSSKEFWDFSWHEIGIYDLPATIDYILNVTNYEKIHYIGHSQGTTIFWVMGSERPEYNNKILSMQALAPIAYLNKVRSPLIALVNILGTLDTAAKILGIKQLLPHHEYVVQTGLYLCQDVAITHSLCSNLIFLIAGFNHEEWNTKMLPAIIGHVPAGCSVKQAIHFGQIKRSSTFRQYDYGMYTNWKKYGSIKPPNYNLDKITAPVYFHYSENDWLAHVHDVEILYEKLNNTKGKHLVSHSKFNHLDFLWATNVKSLVYEKVIEFLKHSEC